MKNINLSFVGNAVLAASMLMAGSTARAEELPQTKAQQQFSVRQGFRDSALPVLHRSTGSNQNKVSAALIEKLGLGSATSSKQGNNLQLAGKQWTMEITADGTGADFHDQAAEGRAHSQGKPLSAKMSSEELEQRGRAFIASKLASQIVLGPNEQLVAEHTNYRIEGGQDLKTEEISQAVVDNRIVFARTLNGVPVVGNGSKITLIFLNDGSLASFRYDWPKYRTSTTQNLVDAGQILTRVQTVLGSRSDVTPATQSVPVPSAEGDAYPLQMTPNTKLVALECGYYDNGSFAGHTTQSVQPGCAYRAISQDTAGMRSGYAGAVPTGAQFEQDSAWLETRLLGMK
jgi:hypothetical protein